MASQLQRKDYIWRIALFGFSCLGIVIFGILYTLYATNKLTTLNIANCELQNCTIINETCKQICPDHQPSCIPANFTCQYKLGNYSFIYHKIAYFHNLRYYVDQECIPNLSCHFFHPNDTVHFIPDGDNQSMGIGLFIIIALIIFITIIVMLPFEYLLKYYNKNTQELLIPTSDKLELLSDDNYDEIK